MSNRNSIILSVVLLCVFFAPIARGQVKTNLDIFHSLLDSSLITLTGLNHYRNDRVCAHLPERAVFLEEYIRSRISTGSDQSDLTGQLIYTIDKIELHYSDMYRDGFLGPYFLVRDFFLVGSIGKDIGGKFTAVPFRFEYRDSIALTARDSIEYGGYQLTQAPLPKEPVFQSLVEPIVAVTAFAAAIYLFFTVRKSN